MHVLGREGDPEGESEGGRPGVGGPAPRLGSFLARDGSDGAAVAVDADRPHAGVVVGKRGTGKSYTLGVLAEGLAEASGVAPVVVDPMGVFGGLDAAGGRTVEPAVRPGALPPKAWPDLLGLDPTDGPGSLLWRVVADACEATASPSVDAFAERAADADAPAATRRAVGNHLGLAASWGVFDADAPPVASLADGRPTVLDLAGVPDAAAGAVVRAVAAGLYEARVGAERVGAERGGPDPDADRLPWLLVDEAHAFFGGVADPALRTLLTRGRAPGVSVVCATQRPGALPDVAVSQADLLVAHRLTAERDVAALATAEATYLAGDLADRLPTGVGEALVVDDATEAAHRIRVRERRTPHGGGSPRASAVEPAAASETEPGDGGDRTDREPERPT